MLCKRFVGFFSENYSSGGYPSILTCVGTPVEYDKRRVIEYLRERGQRKSFVPGVAFDPVDRTMGAIGRLSIYGDGVWCWPEFLPAILDRYDIRLDEEFVRHVFASGVR